MKKEAPIWFNPKFKFTSTQSLEAMDEDNMSDAQYKELENRYSYCPATHERMYPEQVSA